MTGETGGLRRSPWLFLLGVVFVFGSAALFVYDLVSGNSVVRGFAANAAGVALVVALASWETLSDPDSHIGSRGEALRATLFFYGGYLVFAGAVVLVTAALSHPEPRPGLVAVAVGGVFTVVTFVTGAGGPTALERVTTLLGLGGLLLVVASTGLFVYDVATGTAVVRSVAANGVGAALFILWTAYDMPTDPDSVADTLTDALGVALLLYGIYLLVAGAAIAGTALLVHQQGGLGLLYLALGLVTGVLGAVLAPVADLEGPSGDPPTDTDAGEADGDGTGADSGADAGEGADTADS